MERQKQAIKLLFVVIAFAGIVISIGYSSRKRPAGNLLAFAPTTARLERGRYIVEGPAHCFQCHSEVDWKNPGAQPIAGKKGGGTIFVEDGMQWLVAPNISPDVETGAGSWTDEQFARAIREGIGHDGRRLFPMMPYMNFQSMSDEDLASVVVYIRSIAPVRNVLPKTMLPEVVKGSLPPHRAITAPVAGPDMSNQVARGKYLVTLGNCMMCHTPMKQGQPIRELAFGGGLKFTGPWGTVSSANITQDASGISYYDEALFVKTLRTGQVGARKLSSIMPWGYFRNMTDDDLKAIYAYLQTVTPVQHRVDNTEVATACPICGGHHGHGERNHRDTSSESGK